VVQSGARVPDRCVVAPGAVVHGSPGSPEQLLGGVPARTIKSLTGAEYFRRSRGQVQ
jgi:acetyltransferase-like isoleucine patch superfamily enzyme